MGTANDYTHTEGEGKSITYNSSIQSTIGQQKIKGQSTKSDTIYRADAIKAIEDMQDCYNGFSGTYDKAQIIGVLEEVPTAELPETNVGDIISRQTVLNECLELAEARRNWETEEGQAEIRGIDAVMCALHDLPSAQPKWIPCSERLPDIKEHHCSDCCLVYYDTGTYAFAELEENIFGQVGWNCENEDDYHEPIGEVIAWMPLPKPYKGD